MTNSISDARIKELKQMGHGMSRVFAMLIKQALNEACHEQGITLEAEKMIFKQRFIQSMVAALAVSLSNDKNTRKFIDQHGVDVVRDRVLQIMANPNSITEIESDGQIDQLTADYLEKVKPLSQSGLEKVIEMLEKADPSRQ